MADLSKQIQSHINRSIKEGVGEIKFGAGPVKITYFADEGRGIIDVVADSEKNPYKLKEHFNKVRKALPPGEWELNPDTPQKQRIYERWFRKDPNIKPSGDVGMQKIGREGFVLSKPKNKHQPSTARVPGKKQLRPSTPDDILPDSRKIGGDRQAKKQAIKQGINNYIGKDGKIRVIRRYGSEGAPEGKVERVRSRQANRGNLQRRAGTNNITLKDYQKYAKDNGYSPEEARRLYDKNQTELRRVRNRKQTFRNRSRLAYEHYTPTSSRTYGGLEHYRNLGPLGEGPNTSKSDYMITRSTAKAAGIPLTKTDALRMDFEGEKPVPRKIVRNLIRQDLEGREARTGLKPVRARDLNTAVLGKDGTKINAPKRLKLNNSQIKSFFNMLQNGPDGNPGTINPIKPTNQKTNKRNKLKIKMPRTRFNIDRSIGEDLLPTKDVFMDPGGYAPPIGRA